MRFVKSSNPFFQVRNINEIPIVNMHESVLGRKKPRYRNEQDEQPLVILIRGLPGGGKSTLAESLVPHGYRHFETDKFFERNGIYKPDPSKLVDAHAWCLNLVERTLFMKQKVVVSNTFSQLKEMQPYLNLASSVLVVEVGGGWESIHEISTNQKMKIAKRWESL